MSNRLTWNGDRAMRAIRRANLEALWLLGQQVLRDAEPDVPVESGTLRRSGRVTIGDLPDPEVVYAEAKAGTSNEGDKPDFTQSLRRDTVYVSYSTPYALWLHETPNGKATRGKKRRKRQLHSRWHGHLNPRARWKWLERAIPKSRRKFRAIVKRAFDKVGGI